VYLELTDSHLWLKNLPMAKPEKKLGNKEWIIYIWKIIMSTKLDFRNNKRSQAIKAGFRSKALWELQQYLV